MDLLWVLLAAAIYFSGGFFMVRFIMKRRLERITELAGRECAEKLIWKTQQQPEIQIIELKKKWRIEDQLNENLQHVESFMRFYDHLKSLYGNKAVLVLYFLIGILWLPSLIANIIKHERG